MYRSFFEMERMPFVRDVPIQELYESPAMSEALGRLAYAADRQLFAVITADAGCGKFTLLRRFSGSLSKDEYLFLYLSDSKLTPRWFYKSMLDQLGIESKFYRGDAKRQLPVSEAVHRHELQLQLPAFVPRLIVSILLRSQVEGHLL